MEFVYVVKRDELYDLPLPRALVGTDDAHFRVNKLLERIRSNGFFIERRRAEVDPSFKQIIPYCIVKSADKIFLVKRFSTQGERRLHNLRSIGIGGHINPMDDVGDILEVGCERELSEEVSISCPYSKRALGFINDESNPVGSVHFGIVYLVTVETPSVEVKEKDMMEGRFAEFAEIHRLNLTERTTFEPWSQLLIDALPRLFHAFPIDPDAQSQSGQADLGCAPLSTGAAADRPRYHTNRGSKLTCSDEYVDMHPCHRSILTDKKFPVF